MDQQDALTIHKEGHKHSLYGDILYGGPESSSKETLRMKEPDQFYIPRPLGTDKSEAARWGFGKKLKRNCGWKEGKLRHNYALL